MRLWNFVFTFSSVGQHARAIFCKKKTLLLDVRKKNMPANIALSAREVPNPPTKSARFFIFYFL
jgi:hypothetical protein